VRFQEHIVDLIQFKHFIDVYCEARKKIAASLAIFEIDIDAITHKISIRYAPPLQYLSLKKRYVGVNPGDDVCLCGILSR